jgi:hypothetical protein
MLKTIALACVGLGLAAPLRADEHTKDAAVPVETAPSPEPAAPPAASPEMLDPNYSRLLFSPTGRPLKKGDGYFSDYELVFPGVAVGLTDNISIAGGVSLVPGLRLDRQVLYVSPRIGWDLGDKAAVSAGVLYAALPSDDDFDDLAVLFAVGTFGDRRRSLSVGVGFGDANLPDGFDPGTALMIGGTTALSPRIAMVSENWLVLDDDFDLARQPFGLGVRFFGDRVSADVGIVFVPDLVSSGIFLPWASISYHFGPSRPARMARSR